MPPRTPLMIAVMGPTASGKTALAERLADLLDAQLIAADAFQVYRGMDIGTAKPANRDRYLLLDFKDPSESTAVGEWAQMACDALQKLYEQGRSAVFVGGTGFYIRALFEGYADLSGPASEEVRAVIAEREAEVGMSGLADWLKELDPAAFERIDLQNPVRVRRALERALSPKSETFFSIPPYKRVKMALLPDKGELNLRIRKRVAEMMQNGWAAEAAALEGAGYSERAPGMRAIGYKTLLKLGKHELSLEQAIEEISVETRQYAKRQRTWLRSEPEVRVISQFGDTEEAFAEACRLIEVILIQG